MKQSVFREDYSLIRIRELEVFAHHGVGEDEKKNGQNFYINAELYEDISGAATTDELYLTTNYATVCNYIEFWMNENTCELIETVAERLCEDILLKFPLLEGVKLEIRKPNAPITQNFESVSVERQLFWHKAYLSMGSNMGDKNTYLKEGLEALDAQKHTRLIRQSSFLLTEPYGGVPQDDFLNNAVIVQTLLSPENLLHFLHGIESGAGRTREIHWGPRTLDIDILFYDDLIYESGDLVIPHVDLENRAFVLEPLNEIAPNHRHPVSMKTVSQLLKELKQKV